MHGIILPDGHLGVFYRVRAPTGKGDSHYVLGYTERPVQVTLATPAPTFTPEPTTTLGPTPTVPPTLTPVPTPDLNVNPSQLPSTQDLTRIGEILIGMFMVAIVAIIGLRLGRR